MGIKEKFARWRTKQAREKAREEQIRGVERKALQEARLKEAKILAQQRAIIERQEKIKRIRETVSRGRGRGVLRGITERINIAAENLGYGRPGGGLGLSGLAPIPRAPRKKKKRTQPKIIYVKTIPKRKARRKRIKKREPTPQRYDPLGTSF